MHNPEKDIREDIFRSIMDRSIVAGIVADNAGVVAGLKEAIDQAEGIGLKVLSAAESGAPVARGQHILQLSGSPMQIAKGEDRIVGQLAKPSGVATAARKFVEAAAGRLTIVAGAWKKMPVVMKPAIREAAEAGGAQSRISLTRFLYLDKNYTKMFGGISQTLAAVSDIASHVRVIQVCAQHHPIGKEALEAAKNGADIIFVDTGVVEDVRVVVSHLSKTGLRQAVRVAFGGGVRLNMVDALAATDVDLVDVGRAIVDAPLLDMHLDIVET